MDPMKRQSTPSKWAPLAGSALWLHVIREMYNRVVSGCECCCFLVNSISPTCNLCLSVVLVCKVNQHICKLWLTNQPKLKNVFEFNCKWVFNVVAVWQIQSAQIEHCVWVVWFLLFFCNLQEFSFLCYVVQFFMFCVLLLSLAKWLQST